MCDCSLKLDRQHTLDSRSQRRSRDGRNCEVKYKPLKRGMFRFLSRLGGGAPQTEKLPPKHPSSTYCRTLLDWACPSNPVYNSTGYTPQARCDHVHLCRTLGCPPHGQIISRSPRSMFELPFKVKNYKEIKDLYILGDTSEVVANLDDSLVTINTVLSSRYVGGIRGMVDEWRGKLVTLQVCTKRRWSLLVSIIVRQTTNAKLLPCRNFLGPSKVKPLFRVGTSNTQRQRHRRSATLFRG